jgi:hypothetical protein
MDDYVNQIGEQTVQVIARAPASIKVLRDLGGVASSAGIQVA